MPTRATLVLLLAALTALLTACATNGPVAATVAAGAAGVLAVVDQLLAEGVISPEQYQQMFHSMQAIATSLEAAKTAADAATAIATEAKSGGVSPETMVGGLTGTTAAILAAVRLWRGKRTPEAVKTAASRATA